MLRGHARWRRPERGTARLAARREWALNEKGLVRRAGLDAVQAVLAAPGTTPAQLGAAVEAVASALGVAPLAAR